MPERSERPAFVRAVASVLGATVLAAFLSFVNVVIVSRALGTVGRGNVVLLTTIAVLTAQIATLGVHHSVVNIAGRRPEAGAKLATNAVVLAIVLGALGAGFVGGGATLYPRVAGDVEPTILWITLASIPVLIAQAYLQMLAHARYRWGLSNLVALLPAAINVVVNSVLVLLDRLDVEAVVGVWIGGQLLATAIVVRAVVRDFGGFGRPDSRLAREMLGFGLKAHVTDVMMWGNYRLDQWLLGGIAGPRELGRYSVAVDWTEGLFFLPKAVRIVQRPDLIRASPEDAAEQTIRAVRIGILLTIPPTIALFFLAPWLTGLYGPDFKHGTGDLRVLAFGGFGVLILNLVSNALLAQRQPGLQMIAVGSAFAMTIVLDLLLIPPYGGLGAAIASTASYLTGAVVIAVVFGRAFGSRALDLVPRRADAAWIVSKLRSRGAPPAEPGT